MTDLIRGNVPLMLLAVLGRGPAHGYGVITALHEQSAGLFDLPEGTVYPVLHRLERQGLVASRWEDAAPRRRRTYALTAAGRAALAAQTAEWSRLSNGLTKLLGVPA